MTQITIDYAEIWNIFFVFFSINTTLIGKSIQRVHIVVDADSIRSFKFNIKTLTNTVHFITIMGKGNLHGEDTQNDVIQQTQREILFGLTLLCRTI